MAITYDILTTVPDQVLVYSCVLFDSRKIDFVTFQVNFISSSLYGTLRPFCPFAKLTGHINEF